MQTPTIIVRLIGLYLLVNCSIALFQIHQAGGIGGQENSIIQKIQIYAISGLVIGIAASFFAGPLARLLTFDADPKTANSDVSNKLLDRKDEAV